MRSIDRRELVILVAVLLIFSTGAVAVTTIHTVDRPADDSTATGTAASTQWGVEVDVNQNAKNLTAVVSTNTGPVTTAHLWDADTGTEIANTSISNGEFQFTREIESGTYYVLVSSDQEYDRGSYLSPTFPYSSSENFVQIERSVKYTDSNGFYTSQGYAMAIKSVSIELESNQPAVDNTSATPANGDTVTESPVELSINVSDADFPTSQGDSVNVTFYDEDTGSEIGSDTIAANGTATASYSPSGGANNWSAVATDAYGNSVSSQTFTFQAPDELVIRNEQNPDGVLTNVNVSVTAYYGDETLRRSTSNGRIDLSGFPIDQPVIVRASAENYTTRTVVVESIIQQSSIYLLNESTTTHDVRFSLEDPSGRFTSDDTVLLVQRDLEQNGSVEWRTIAGDNFGVQGTPVTLASRERYRLRIRNLETGQTAVIGAYTAIQSESVTISPGSATIDIVESNRDYGWSAVQNESSQSILFEYFDTANQTESVTLTIHERFNKSNILVDNTTISDANNIVYYEQLTNSEANRTWMAEIYVERGGQTFHFREPISGANTNIIPIDLGDGWRTGIGAFILLVTGMAFSSLNRSSGAVATSLVGGLLWQVGFLSLTTSGPMVVMAIFVSVVYHYRGGQQ